MKVDIPSGRYVVAVSGGVDSMVLLDLLRHHPDLELVVAHFNHGIRSDGVEDEKLVKQMAKQYGLELKIGRGELGPNASEATARQARYNFLEQVKKDSRAVTIITAHHQDDLIETAFINLIRGNSRRGLSSIATNPGVIRPLLGYRKAKLVHYAKGHRLPWREDSTNKETKHLRNYLRIKVIPRLKRTQRGSLLKSLEKIARANTQIDEQIAIIAQDLINGGQIDRHKFSMLPDEVGREVLMFWLRGSGASQADKTTIARLSTALKTGQAGSTHPVRGRYHIVLSKQLATLSR